MKIKIRNKKEEGWFFSWLPRFAEDAEGNICLVFLQWVYRYVNIPDFQDYKYYLYNLHGSKKGIK